jgi:mycofactocin precursor
MADVSPTTTAATVDRPASDPETAPEVSRDVQVDELDDLVEDVSIDGMCGVY